MSRKDYVELSKKRFDKKVPLYDEKKCYFIIKICKN
jgi:hypothetical protein